MRTSAAALAKEAPAKQKAGRSSAPAALAPQPVFAPPMVVQRKCACGGGCPSCEEEQRLESGKSNQTKLAVSAPGDPYEQEADRIADQAVRMPEGSPSLTSAPPTLQRKYAAREEEDEKSQVRRKPAEAMNTNGTVETPPIVHEVLRSPGQPLDAAVRAFFEPRFGHDFSQVRIHVDAQANESARSINAEAYTAGHDVVFAAAQYAPSTATGRRLLAHELVHVVQQSGAMAMGGLRTPDDKTGAGGGGGGKPLMDTTRTFFKRHFGRYSGRVSIQRFTTKEHTEIGEVAYQLVAKSFTLETLKQSPLADTLLRGSRFQVGEHVKTYGNLLADPDFFDQFEDLIKEEGKRPGHMGQALLAARNIAHFSPHNVKLWEQLHDAAVNQMLLAYHRLDPVVKFFRTLDPIAERAREAIAREDLNKARIFLDEYASRLAPRRRLIETLSRSAGELARDALMRNAFADHFLTDAFASGHIVTPRAEILTGVQLEKPVSVPAAVQGVLFPPWKDVYEIRAQARALAWHDLDNYFGVEVTNGKKNWVACGDGCSERTSGSHWPETYEMVIKATQESIRHLWMAGLSGTRPGDYRSVLDLVPWPTFIGYPGWGQSDWENQLRFTRGEKVVPVPGSSEPLKAFSLALHSRYGEDEDWIRKYSFGAWVRPMIAAIKARAKERYHF